jgi:transcriptional regulator with XRE-family HTH domain
MDNNNMIGKELRAWRVENGYSQNDLAKALGVITLTVSRWERGDREIPPFLHLALKALPKRGGEIRRGRPTVKGSTTEKKMKKERKVKKQWE